MQVPNIRSLTLAVFFTLTYVIQLRDFLQMLLVYENALQFGKRPFHICNSRQLPIDTSAMKFYEPKDFEDPMLRKTSARQPSGASISRT